MKGFFRNTTIGFLIVVVVTISVLWLIGNEAKKDEKLVFNKENVSSTGLGQEETGELSTLSTKMNKTDEIAREIYVNYLSESSDKKPGDVTEKEIVSVIEEASVSEMSTVKTYTANDVHVVDSAENLLLLYQKNLEAISDTYFFEELGTEPDLLKQVTAIDATAEEREGGIKGLQRAETSYTGIRDALLKTPVPSKNASRHVELINIYEKFAVSVSLMQKAGNDQIYVVPATKIFVEALKSLFLLQTL